MRAQGRERPESAQVARTTQAERHFALSAHKTRPLHEPRTFEYVFSTFGVAGCLAADNDELFEGPTPAKLDANGQSGPYKSRLPLDLEVIDFPDK
jgi:hypothetical protein